jgi:membrane fusion protein
MRSTLFRQEAIDSLRDRHLGDALTARPLALSVLTGLSGLVALAVLLFGLIAEYTRKAHVTGYLAPTHGVIKLHAPQAGTLTETHVEEGRRVARGDPLYALSSERSSPAAPESQAAAIAQLRERRASLAGEIEQQAALALLAQQDLEQRLRDVAIEITQVDAAVATQGERLAGSRATLERHATLARQGFFSEAQLVQAARAGAGAASAAAGARAQPHGLAARSRVARCGAGRAAAEKRPRARCHRARDFGARPADHGIRIAPHTRDHRASRRCGDGDPRRAWAKRRGGCAIAVNPPEGAVLQAQLLVPGRAVGFLAAGQPVALRYQAFPFQRFGSSHGVVKEIARSLIAPGDAQLPVALNEPAYRITVALERQTVRAYGKDFPLQDGMLLEADVALDRRRLLEWLFEPLLALAGRV